MTKPSRWLANAQATTPEATSGPPRSLALTCRTCGAPHAIEDGRRWSSCRHCGAHFGEEDTMSSETSAVVARWEAFVTKVEARLRETLAEGDASLEQLGRSAQTFDAGSEPTSGPQYERTASNVMQAVSLSLVELRQKLGDTFSAQALPLLVGGDRERAIDRTNACDLAIQEASATWQSGWRVRLLEASRAAFEAAQHATVTCPQCGSTLRPANPWALSTVRCGACRADVSYFPETRAATYAANAPHVYAEARALPQRLAIERMRLEAREKVRRGEWRPEPRASLEAWERAEVAYFTTYFETKLAMEGKPREEVASWVASRMREFYERMRSEPAWSSRAST